MSEPVWIGQCVICGYQDIHTGDPEDAGEWCPRWSMHGDQPPPRLEPFPYVPEAEVTRLREALAEKEGDNGRYRKAVCEEVIEAQAELQAAMGLFRLKHGRDDEDGIDDLLSRTLARLHLLLHVLGTPMYRPARHPAVGISANHVALQPPKPGGEDRRGRQSLVAAWIRQAVREALQHMSHDEIVMFVRDVLDESESAATGERED